MKRILGIVVFILAVALAFMSCEREAKVIPVRKMEKIYREMFLADQWLEANPDKRGAADTTWFYGSIFEKYGVSLLDYQKSVDYYLNDPERYADMVGRVAKRLQKELEDVNEKIALDGRLKHEADSISRAKSQVHVKPFPSFLVIFNTCSMTDRIHVEMDSLGVYCPVPVLEDTVFLGPELIIRNHEAKNEADTLERTQECHEYFFLPGRSDKLIKLTEKPLKITPIAE